MAKHAKDEKISVFKKIANFFKRLFKKDELEDEIMLIDEKKEKLKIRAKQSVENVENKNKFKAKNKISKEVKESLSSLREKENKLETELEELYQNDEMYNDKDIIDNIEEVQDHIKDSIDYIIKYKADKNRKINRVKAGSDINNNHIEDIFNARQRKNTDFNEIKEEKIAKEDLNKQKENRVVQIITEEEKDFLEKLQLTYKCGYIKEEDMDKETRAKLKELYTIQINELKNKIENERNILKEMIVNE